MIVEQDKIVYILKIEYFFCFIGFLLVIKKITLFIYDVFVAKDFFSYLFPHIKVTRCVPAGVGMRPAKLPHAFASTVSASLCLALATSKL